MTTASQLACNLIETNNTTSAGTNATPLVVPTLQNWTGGTGSWTLTSASRIVVDQPFATQLTPFATTLASDLVGITGLTLPVVASTTANPSDIVLTMAQCNSAVTAQIGKEGNTLLVQNGVFLRATTPEGVFHATRTLLQILTLDGQASGSHKYVENGYSVDYPNFAFRSVMLDAGRLFMTKEFVEDYIRFISWYKINTLHLHLNDEAQNNSGGYTGYFRLLSPSFPALFPPDGTGGFPAGGIPTETTGDTMHGYTSLDWSEMEAVAAAHGVEIEPEIDSPGHSTAFIAANPGIAVSGDPINLDTGKPATLPYMESVWAQFLPWFQSKDIMMGGDEASPDVATEPTYLASLANFITATPAPGGAPRTVAIWNDGFGQTSTTYNAPLLALDKSLIVQQWDATDATYFNLGFTGVVNSNGPYSWVLPTSNTATSMTIAAALYGSWTLASADLGGQFSMWNDHAIVDAITDAGDNSNFKDVVPAIGQRLWTGPLNSSSGALVPYGMIGSALPTLGYGPGITELTGQLLAPPVPYVAAYLANAASNTLGGGAIPQTGGCVNCSSTSRIGYMGSLTYNGISVSATGTYTLLIGYGNGSTGAMTANVSFDGATPVVVTFPATGGYGQIQTVSVTGVFQQGSTNTLKISPVAPATTAPDMDGISAPVL